MIRLRGGNIRRHLRFFYFLSIVLLNTHHTFLNPENHMLDTNITSVGASCRISSEAMNHHGLYLAAIFGPILEWDFLKS